MKAGILGIFDGYAKGRGSLACPLAADQKRPLGMVANRLAGEQISLGARGESGESLDRFVLVPGDFKAISYRTDFKVVPELLSHSAERGNFQVVLVALTIRLVVLADLVQALLDQVQHGVGILRWDGDLLTAHGKPFCREVELRHPKVGIPLLPKPARWRAHNSKASCQASPTMVLQHGYASELDAGGRVSQLEAVRKDWLLIDAAPIRDSCRALIRRYQGSHEHGQLFGRIKQPN